MPGGAPRCTQALAYSTAAPTDVEALGTGSALTYSTLSTLSASDNARSSLIQRVAISVTIGLAYIVISGAMILFNKIMMSQDKFPFPAALTLWHMALSALCTATLYRVAPALFPSAESVGSQCSTSCDHKTWYASRTIYGAAGFILRFMPIAALGVLPLVAGNAAYQYGSVQFLQLIKESHIVFAYALSVIVGLEIFRASRMLVLMFVAVSSMFAVGSGLHFSGMAFFLQFVCGLAGSCQSVLSSKLMATGSKIDPMTFVLLLSPIQCLALLPVTFVCWDPRIPARLVANSNLFLLNGFLAVTLQVVTAVSLLHLAPTGVALSSVLKDVTIVVVSGYAFGEHLEVAQIIGFGGAILGILVYSAMKLFPSWFESADAKGGRTPA